MGDFRALRGCDLTCDVVVLAFLSLLLFSESLDQHLHHPSLGNMQDAQVTEPTEGGRKRNGFIKMFTFFSTFCIYCTYWQWCQVKERKNNQFIAIILLKIPRQPFQYKSLASNNNKIKTAMAIFKLNF